jgi:hypothetical protein
MKQTIHKAYTYVIAHAAQEGLLFFIVETAPLRGLTEAPNHPAYSSILRYMNITGLSDNAQCRGIRDVRFSVENGGNPIISHEQVGKKIWRTLGIDGQGCKSASSSLWNAFDFSAS